MEVAASRLLLLTTCGDDLYDSTLAVWSIRSTVIQPGFNAASWLFAYR